MDGPGLELLIIFLLPMAMLFPKAIDTYLYGNRAADFFAAEFAAVIALVLVACVIAVVTQICAILENCRRSKSRVDTKGTGYGYLIFVIIVGLAVLGMGVFCAAGNFGSAVSNDAAARATTEAVLEEVLAKTWRMDPFGACRNNATRIVEAFRHEPAAFESLHRSAALFQFLIGLAWLAVAIGLFYMGIHFWREIYDDLATPVRNQPQQPLPPPPINGNAPQNDDSLQQDEGDVTVNIG